MKKWFALALSAVMLLGMLAGCKKEEEMDLTPDDQMTIAIAALARSVKTQKEAIKPTQYTVKGTRYLDGTKTMESVTSYNNETLFAVSENRYFDGEDLISTEITYTYVASVLGTEEDGFRIISATVLTQGEDVTKEYSVLYTGADELDVQNAWAEGKYGADMSYQTYGRLEDLIISVAMSQGGAEAKITSAKDFTLTIDGDTKTERYTVENDYLTKFVWTEMTANGEDESTWEYFWNVAEVTLPDLSEFVLVTE